jgi:ribonucleotide reductase beta subunit family protein with ferritin-like domain/glutaredoxin
MYTILSRRGCWGCERAADLLQDRATLVECTGRVAQAATDMGLRLTRPADTYPQIFKDGTHLGGLDELEMDLASTASSAPPPAPAPGRCAVLTPSTARFTAFPVEHPDLWALYKRAVASFWTADEISLAKDVAEFELLSPSERHFITHVLAFFASSDGIVQENLAKNFLGEVQLAEARQFFSYQIFNEAIHNETYSVLIDALVRDPATKAATFAAITDLPAVRDKAAWALKWLDASRPFAERLVAFVCVEGILFSGSFCAVYWLKTRGLMPGLGLSNQFISRDEGLHCEFGVALYAKLADKIPGTRVQEIVREAVENEQRFITDAVPCDLVGMNPASMSAYIEFVADRLLVSLGADKVYGSKNPFPWMELISLSGKDNFFERVASEYQKAGVLGGEASQVFALDEAF